MKGVYQLKVVLNDFRPPIWRRLVINSQATYFELHSLLQDAFGWEDYHLHAFKTSRNKGKKRIYIQDQKTNEEWQYPIAEESRPPIEERDEFLDEMTTKIAEYLALEFPKMKYEYDFGDSWEHEIILEKVIDRYDGAVPAVLSGKRQAPPDDSRGWIHGAQEIVAAGHDKRSSVWAELVSDWGNEAAEDFVSMSKYFLFEPFNVQNIDIMDPKERLERYNEE